MEHLTVFEKLLTPLLDYVTESGSKIDQKSGSRKLFFIEFVQVSIFGMCIGVSSMRQLIKELSSNETARKLGLRGIAFSTYKDGFSRFNELYFKELYIHILSSVTWFKVKGLEGLGVLKAVDGSLFPTLRSMDWASYKRDSKAMKLHLSYDISHSIPSEFLLTSGNHSERKFLIDILANGVTYICDRGYFSFDVLAAINKVGALFVFRIKNNYRYVVGKKLALSGLLPICFSQVSDELVRFSNDPQSCVYRVVRFKVLDTFFILCTNRLDLTTIQIIMLYAYRWRIELIFKFLKRTLNGLHLFAHHQQGAPIHFYLLLITAVLQMHLKQSFCQQQQHNKSVSTPSKCIQNVKMEQFDIENLTNKNDTADKWVHNINTIFTDSFKISVNWLLYLKNYLAHSIDYHIVRTLATT